MNRVVKYSISGFGAVAALAIGYVGYSRLYATPRAALLAEWETARTSIETYQSKLQALPAVRDGLKAAAANTLGDKKDTAEHRFRTTLNSIAEGCGLREIKVDNRDPSEVRNPAGQQKLSDRFARTLRAQVDFMVIKGTVRGIGSLDQVLRATAAISAQSWVHRVDSFSIRPVGTERERFELRLSVATMFMPDLAPKSAPEPARIELTAAAADAWRPIVDKNVFKVPAPVVVAVAPPPSPPVQEPLPPPPEPYSQWKLTGVVESSTGCEALLVNVKTNERSTLAVGGTLLDAVFESGAGERAVFRIAEQRFEVVMGSTLDQRRPVNR